MNPTLPDFQNMPTTDVIDLGLRAGIDLLSLETAWDDANADKIIERFRDRGSMDVLYAERDEWVAGEVVRRFESGAALVPPHYAKADHSNS
jgi:hypothetical protein